MKMKLLFCTVLLLVFNSKSTSSERKSKIITVSAKAVKSKTVKEHSKVTGDGSFVFATDDIEFTFKKIELIRGEDKVELPSKLIFTINTSYNFEHQLMSAKRVILLLEYIDEEDVNLLEWAIPRKIACFNEKNITNKQKYIKAEFGNSESKLCRILVE